MAGRAMRASPGKQMTRILAFGHDSAAASIGQLIHVYDRDSQNAITLGVAPDTYAGHASAVSSPSLRAKLADSANEMEKKVAKRLSNIVVAAVDNSTLRTVQVEAF
eukprot:6581792-Prymnesium_polylepis.1